MPAITNKAKEQAFQEVLSRLINLIDLHLEWITTHPVDLLLADQVQRQLINLLIILKPSMDCVRSVIPREISTSKLQKLRTLYQLLEVTNEVVVIDDVFECSKCFKRPDIKDTDSKFVGRSS